jgi:hypothetical protein
MAIDLLPLDDPRWASYRSGYRRVFDCRPLLQHLADQGFSDWLWDKLWEELHHQGDVDEASYAVLPYLVSHAATLDAVDVEVLAYAYVVEACRRNPDGQKNPDVPAELRLGYEEALAALPSMMLSKAAQDWSEDHVKYFAAMIAVTRGHLKLARAWTESD